MTVVVSNGISIRPWRGYDDPGLPVGMWFAQNSVVGDASGGSMLIIFIFKGEAEPVSGRFFNIEQMNIFHSATATKSGSLLLNNWETIGPVGLVNQQFLFRLQTNSNNVSALDFTGYFPLPFFMGSAAPVASLSSQVEVKINNVDLTSLTVTLQGYIWEARSVQAEGGLRRPVDSLYGGGGRG